MRTLVVGAYGLIGSYVTARLLADGHTVVGVGRDIAAARRRLPSAEWIALDLRAALVQDWIDALAGVEAVVNCAGALQDSPRDDLAAVHVEGVRRLLEACAAIGVRRFVHVSAAGMASGRGAAFNDTKLAGEAVVAASSLEWLILRPGLVLAPAAYGGTALLRGLAGFPGVIPAAYADSVVQVVSAEDVALAVAQGLAPGAPSRTHADVLHPDRIALGEILRSLRCWLGFPPAPILNIPASLAGLTARLSDGLALLGWRSPMRTTALAQLRAGVEGGGTGAAVLGVQPKSLAQMLEAWPSSVQERWFARAYFLKPAMLATLAGFWALSGVIGLLRQDTAASVLTSAGVTEDLARIAVIGGSFVDIALGLAVAVRRWARPALLGMLAVSAGYMAVGGVLRPDLWLDPLGPFLKTLPAALLAVAALALLDER